MFPNSYRDIISLKKAGEEKTCTPLTPDPVVSSNIASWEIPASHGGFSQQVMERMVRADFFNGQSNKIRHKGAWTMSPSSPLTLPISLWHNSAFNEAHLEVTISLDGNTICPSGTSPCRALNSIRPAGTCPWNPGSVIGHVHFGAPHWAYLVVGIWDSLNTVGESAAVDFGNIL